MGAFVGIADRRRSSRSLRVLDGRHLQVDEGEGSIVPGQNGASDDGTCADATLLGGSSRVARPESVCLQVSPG